MSTASPDILVPATDDAVEVLIADAGDVVVPGGDMMLKADFVRDGADLVLVGEDGETIIVRDYFLSDSPPSLHTTTGAIITADLAAKLAGPAPGSQLAQSGTPGAADAVGRINTVEGSVIITRTNGDRVDGSPGTPIFQGDVVETKPGGSLEILFADDTSFSLGEEGRMVIDEMIYDPVGETGSASLNVVQGVFAFVSGKIAKTGEDAMLISTPVAAIGVRGTTATGNAQQEGSTNTFTLLADLDGGVGIVTIQTSVGVVTLTVPLASTQVTSAFAPPLPVVILPPAAVQQLYGNVGAAAVAGLPGGGGGTAGGTGDVAAAVDAVATGALADALAGGASLDEAFAAATDAGVVAAQDAFENALAGGLSEEAALQSIGGVALSGITTDSFSISGMAEGFVQAFAGSDSPLAVGSFVGGIAGAVNDVDQALAEVIAEITGDIEAALGIEIGSLGGGSISVVGGDLAGALFGDLGGFDEFGGDGFGDFGDFGDFGKFGGGELEIFGPPPGEFDFGFDDPFDDIPPEDIPENIAQAIGASGAVRQALAATTESSFSTAIDGLVAAFSVAVSNPIVQNFTGSGTLAVTLTPFQPDAIVGNGNNQTFDLLSSFIIGAGVGDSVDGGGGTDGVLLPVTENIVQLTDVDSVTIPRTNLQFDFQAIQFGTAGTLAVELQSGSDPAAPLLISGVGSSGNNNLAQILDINFALNGGNAAAFALSGGSDTINLTGGTNNIFGILDVENVNFGTGTGNLTFTLPIGNATTVTIGGSDGATNTHTLNLSADGPNQVTLNDEITVNGGGFADTFKYSPANITAKSNFNGGAGVDTLEIANDQTPDFTSSTLANVEILSALTASSTTFILDAADLSGLTQITAAAANSSLSIASNSVDLTSVEILTNVSSLTGGLSGQAITFDLDDVNFAAFTTISANGTGTINVGSDTTVDLTGTTFNNVALFNANQANTAQTITIDGRTALNGMDFTGTEESAAVFDDIVASAGDIDLSDVTLTNVGFILANNASLSQTISANANSQLFGGEIQNFDASGGTNDVFDYVSALKAGDGTEITAGTAITLRSLTGQPAATVLSVNSTGAVELDFSQAFLNFDIQGVSESTLLGNIQGILESGSFTSGGAATAGVTNTDMLLIFYEASSQGTTTDAVVVRYQEGNASEASFSGELSVVADFEGVFQGAFDDASFN